MMNPSSIKPDRELRDYLRGRVSAVSQDGSTVSVPIYGDWEKPTKTAPEDFIIIMNNGGPSGLGMDIDFASGNVAVGLYCKLKEDGSVKSNRIEKILEQFESLINKRATENYFFEYEQLQFITPTTPNLTSGYSVTTLNLKWTTTNNFNKPVTP